MRVLFASLLFAISLPVLADDTVSLYQAAGWPEQRGHFRDALQAAQQRYQNSLPPALYQSLVDNSNKRYTAAAIDQRALAALRQSLPADGPALQFFQSPVGRKVVAAEIAATRSDQLAKNANGVPQMQASPARRAQAKRLATALPVREAGAEVVAVAVVMDRNTGAKQRVEAAGLPYLAYLRHPTTGGVFASWGSLGHMTIAEPGALIGFLGPVVYETVNGVPFPEGVQVAENLVDKGIVDAVVPVEGLAEIAARALTLLSTTT